MKHSKVLEIIENRRSIRSYLNTPIPEEDLNEILETGLYAPSGKNRKPWRFLIIKDKDKIKEISRLTTYSRFIRNAPVLVLVYIFPSEEYPIEKDIFSVGACVQNILLTATEKGYGTCIIGEMTNKEQPICELLDKEISNGKIVCGISIGAHTKTVYPNRTAVLKNFLLSD